jgi:hypothetical protein
LKKGVENDMSDMDLVGYQTYSLDLGDSDGIRRNSHHKLMTSRM